MIEWQQVFSFIEDNIAARPTTESVAVEEAVGRVCAVDLRARRQLPGFDNSAMDGFAVRRQDTPGTLRISQTILAGQIPSHLQPGTAAKIMTGAMVPLGADAIIMKENAQVGDSEVTFAEAAILGRHIRRANEDTEVGDPLLAAGCTIDAGHVPLLAAQGYQQVDVARKVRTIHVATGSELVPPGQTPTTGQIVETNGVQTQVRLRALATVEKNMALDARPALRQALELALAHDAVITSGGVSVGDADLVKSICNEIGGKEIFWKVALKPGKPFFFAMMPGDKPLFGLPGNPVSAAVCLELFVKPALRRMLGCRAWRPVFSHVRLAEEVRKRPGRAHFIRATLDQRSDGTWATPQTKMGSGQLTSLVGADALVEIEIDASLAQRGQWCRCLVL